MRTPSRGITLVELVIYVAILAVIIAVVSFSAIQFVQTFNRVRAERRVYSAAETALERIVREIRLACAANASASTLILSTYPSHISPDPANCTITRTISLNSGTIQMQDGGGQAMNLTPPNVTVTNVVFSQMSDTRGSSVTDIQAVRVEFQVTASSITKSYYASAILRGSL